MLSTFLSHQWTGFRRSRGKTGTIAVQLIMGFLVLYIIAVSILVGYSMEEIIEHLLPGKEVILVFNGMILYYFAIDFIVRLQMQELPTLAVVPYLHLNIPKRKLVNFLNIRALFSAFNILPIFIFFPFCILNIGHNYGSFTCAIYLLTILSLTVFNNYAGLYFKRISADNIKIVIAGLLFLTTVGLLEYFKVFSIASLSNLVFHHIILYPVIGFVFPALAIAMYIINDRFLKRNLYIEELKSGEEKKSSTDYPFLDRFGETGALVALEIKLILRNKGPKATVAKGFLFLCYGFLLYKQNAIDHNYFGRPIFAAVLMTGNTIAIYGQFMFGWQSAEFDGMLARKVDIKTFFKAKFLTLTLASTLLTIIVSFYGLMSWKILVLQLSAYVYNIGVSTVLILYFATRNYRYIDLSKRASFKWQGVSASTMIMALPLFIIPILIYYALSFIDPYWGIAGLAIAGLLGLATRNFWINVLTAEFNKRRHQIAAGFRERS